MTFNDIFKSSFLENVNSISLLDMGIALVLAFLLGLFIFMIYKKTFSGVMYITLSDMGSMGMGGGKGGGFPGGRPDDKRGQGNQIADGNAEGPTVEVIPTPDIMEPDAASGVITSDRGEESEAMPEQRQNHRFPNGNMMPQDFGNQMPMGGDNNRSMPEEISNAAQSVQSSSMIPLLSVSVLVLLIGLFIAKKYRR